MKRGPKPKPAAKARKQGNPGKRQIKTQKAVSPSDASIPSWLSTTAREIWASQLPRMLALGYFTDTDKPAFARLCDHIARWLRLRESVEKRGETYETRSKHGRMKRINPDFQVMLQLEEKISRLEDRFGLTPIQREAILSRLTDPSGRVPIPPPTGGHTAPSEGMPRSPLAMLSPDQFRRQPPPESTH